jgi:hypothetical protein
MTQYGTYALRAGLATLYARTPMRPVIHMHACTHRPICYSNCFSTTKMLSWRRLNVALAVLLTILRVGQPWISGWIYGRGNNFSLLQTPWPIARQSRLRTSGALFLAPPFTVEVKNKWSFISSNPVFLHGMEGLSFTVRWKEKWNSHETCLFLFYIKNVRNSRSVFVSTALSLNGK